MWERKGFQKKTLKPIEKVFLSRFVFFARPAGV